MEQGSPWFAGLERLHFDDLEVSTTADVCIIGGGITGILTAYLLAKAGKDVVLLEKGYIGEGATGDTTAFITQVIDTNLQDLQSTFGAIKAKKIIQSHRSAIDLIEKIATDEGIACDFVRVPNYIYAAESKEREDLDAELEAGNRLGLAIERGSASLGIATAGYLEIADQAKFHPLKFVYGLTKRLTEMGVRIYEHSEVTKVEPGQLKRVCTKRQYVDAPWVVSAAYEPFAEPTGLFFKKGMYVTYMYEFETFKDLPEGIYEDLQNPYHYFRVDKQNGTNNIIMGGEDHRYDVPVDASKNFQALHDYIEHLFGGTYTLKRQWRGPILEPIDGLAFIGPYKDERMLYAFGFSGNGMTYAGIAAQIFCDAVMGEANPYKDLYAADRIPTARSLVQKGKDYVEELANGAVKNAVTYRKHK
jgi:glycine/D-amino acid oxidase-like deaminating enzyme